MDVSALDVGESLHVRDLVIPQGVTVLSDIDLSVVSVVLPGSLPDATPLVDSLAGQVPNGVTIVVDAGVGEQVQAGVVGAPSS